MTRLAAPAQRGLPAFHELPAAPDWTRIDFVSDIHLAPDMPRTGEAWAAYLLATPADAVFILGDLFDAWVGDDARLHGFEAHCAQLLGEAAGRRALAFMAGNRDFLLGPDMRADCAMTALPDPTVLLAFGQRVLLSHGDALCLGDTEYQHFRARVRTPQWQAQVLALPLDERRRLAAQMRHASEQRSADGLLPAAAADIDSAAAVEWLQRSGSTVLVHGHTHRPGSEALAPGLTRHVLSDWDLDHGPKSARAEVLRLTRAGFSRLSLAAAAMPDPAST